MKPFRRWMRTRQQEDRIAHIEGSSTVPLPSRADEWKRMPSGCAARWRPRVLEKEEGSSLRRRTPTFWTPMEPRGVSRPSDLSKQTVPSNQWRCFFLAYSTRLRRCLARVEMLNIHPNPGPNGRRRAGRKDESKRHICNQRKTRR